MSLWLALVVLVLLLVWRLAVDMEVVVAVTGLVRVGVCAIARVFAVWLQ